MRTKHYDSEVLRSLKSKLKMLQHIPNMGGIIEVNNRMIYEKSGFEHCSWIIMNNSKLVTEINKRVYLVGNEDEYTYYNETKDVIFYNF